jgi:tRNA dimethylallyltransferase
MSEKAAILIAGPTASGKSAAALALARRLGGVVINADSMQVYRDLRILTARPTPEDEARAPHLLYGHVDAAHRYSVGEWLKDAQAAAETVWRQGRVPVFTGGTGLYFRALEEGLAKIPPVPEAIRARVAGWAAEGPEQLRRQARALDLSRIPRDRQRLVRALEVRLATGRELHAFHGTETPLLNDDVRVLRLFIAPDRQRLRKVIAERFHRMLAAGAVEEVRRLLARGLDPALPAMKAHGVRNIAAALRGEISMEQAAEGAIAETRQYAKRQMTWARRYMRHWQWVSDSAAAAAVDWPQQED